MIRLVVCDLDNTLYDWVDAYVAALDAMVDCLVAGGLDRDTVLDALQQVHRHHGSSEYALALAELPPWLVSGLDAHHLHRAARAFRAVFATRLRLYPDVAATLAAAKRQGRLVVAYTDAMVAYADFRLEQLGLLDLVDELVGTADHPVDDDDALDAFCYFPLVQFRRRSVASCVALREDQRKPDPAGMLELLDRHDIAAQEALYVGDSLTKDVAMAQAAGMIDVHAAYGRSYSDAAWARLVRITHWTAADVEAERRRALPAVTPRHVIDRFGDLTRLLASLDASATATASA